MNGDRLFSLTVGPITMADRPFRGGRRFLAELDRPSVREVAIAYPVAANRARPLTDQLSIRVPHPVRPARTAVGPDSGSGFGGSARTAGMSVMKKTGTANAAQGCEPRTQESVRLAGGVLGSNDP